MDRWFPHATVATIVPNNGRYLLVEEHAEHGVAFNQPAGHLEEGESLVEAAARETFEETGWRVEVTGLLGISRYIAQNNVTYLRFTFIAEPLSHDATLTLDNGIIAAHWLSRTELENMAIAGMAINEASTIKASLIKYLRSPLVLNDIARFESGERLPLSVIYDHPAVLP